MRKSLYAILAALSLATGMLPLATTGADAAGCTRTDTACPPPVIPDPKEPDGDPDSGSNTPFPEGPTVSRQGAMLIGCRISGTPEAMPDDLKFRNIGDLTIPAGTRVYWLVAETREYGWFVLPEDLPVGKSIPEADVLAAGLPVTDHCHSRVV